MSDTRFIIWEPVSRTDVAWNFEKFLIAPNGMPFRRYSRNFQTKDLVEDIQTLLDTADNIQRDVKDLIGQFGGLKVKKVEVNNIAPTAKSTT